MVISNPAWFKKLLNCIFFTEINTILAQHRKKKTKNKTAVLAALNINKIL